LSLLHYDEITDQTPLPSRLTVRARTLRPTEFQSFRRYGGLFSSATRTFLIRLWIGIKADAITHSQLDRSLVSLRLP
jgi:hypothetical protein